MMAQISHQSRVLSDRSPYGAQPAGSQVRLRVHDRRKKRDGDQALGQVRLAYAYGLTAFVESSSLMQPIRDDQAAFDSYEVQLDLPPEPALLFYWFELQTPRGTVYLTCDRDDFTGGSLVSADRPRFLPGQPKSPLAWQITVYDPAFSVPDWLSGQVLYQIFPDRFRRDQAFTLDRFAANDRPERIFHTDWSEEVDIEGKPETGYLACDFFGGSIAGIREKLDYLTELGVSVLSLNPIFEARSNHRYDTADYLQVDPLLGREETFIAFCQAARQRGIRVILDGVFNHTGADSRYFNRYGRYPETGAWQQATGSQPSAYGSWYRFSDEEGRLTYDAWWGFPELPAVEEADLSYRAFMTGPDGVVRRWLRLGASGWRLDVSDELPDYFLRAIRAAAKAERSDAVVIGEVWEDASNKISYGAHRDFLLGRTHDAVMNYPFRRALIGWLAGHMDAQWMNHELETLREHYPKPAFDAAYNLISSHDVERALTALAGDPDPGSRQAQARLSLSDDQRQTGLARLRLAVLFQMIYPGCPVIYYGDEVGLEGYRDPFNRRTFPWGQEEGPLTAFVAQLGQLRRRWPVLQRGDLRMHLAWQDCCVFERLLLSPPGGPERVLLALNRGTKKQVVSWQDRQLELPPMGFWLEADGQAVLLTKG